MMQYTTEGWFNYGTLKNSGRRNFNENMAEANEELGSVLGLTETLGREIMGALIKKSSLHIFKTPAGAMYKTKSVLPSLPIVLGDNDILDSSDSAIDIGDCDIWQSYELPVVHGQDIAFDLMPAIQVEEEDIILEKMLDLPVEDLVKEIEF